MRLIEEHHTQDYPDIGLKSDNITHNFRYWDLGQFYSIFTYVFRKSHPERYMKPDIWLIRYSEIFLKSEPVRRVWEDLLIQTLKQKLPDCSISKTRGRIWITGDVDPEAIAHTFGVYSFSPCIMFPLSDLNERVLTYVKETGFSAYKTFALRINRSGTHPFTSQDLARTLGASIQKSWPSIAVDLTNPKYELHIEVRDEQCYLYQEIISGPGGIPQGASGTLVALHSGGIDSPVAMFMMMKRGAILRPVYVKIAPFHDDRSEERANLIVEHLRKYQPDLTLEVIDDGHLYATRMELKKRDLEKYACVLCKRHLYRIAEQKARAIGAKGIVTGESLAQVASQTLDNLYVLDDAVSMPVYRPLIGFDKEETIAVAKKIGTYDLSVMQVPSCCCAIPFKPATTSQRETISTLEEELAKGSPAK